jgi:hypothetical protein
MIKKLVALATAALLTGCVTAADKFQTDMPIGTVVTDKVSTPQGDVLLPPGKWTVVGKDLFRNNNYHPFGQVALAQISVTKELDGLVFFTTPLESHFGYGFYATGACDRREGDLYHEKSSNQELGVQGCFSVRDLGVLLDDSDEAHLTQADSYLDTHNVYRHDSMLFSAYRVVRGHKLLVVQYGFNYRQPTGNVIPGYTPAEKFNYDKSFGRELWKTNLETVIAWSKEKEDTIRSTFLD